MVGSRIVLFMVVAGLLWTAPAEAQRLACGGHRIEWAGAAPVGSFSGEPPVDRTPGGTGSGGSGGYDTTHYDGAQPTIPEPPGLNRERWDALVFSAYGFPSPDRETLVLHREIVPMIKICLQSADESKTGERLAEYADASWWRRQIERWTGLSWSGEIRVAACTGQPPDGWVYVRESVQLPDSEHAAAASWREPHPHGYGRWRHSTIDWNADHVETMGESYFETVLAHELGHVMGFGHVPADSGYIMSNSPEGWSEEESSLAHLAYRVGPNVRYPGLVRADAGGGAGEDHPDRAPLTALYDATGGESWDESTNWGTDERLVYWHGVATDEDERVIEVDLHVNNLKGMLPPELGDLSSLRTLNIEENYLTGALPPELGRLTNLEWLTARENNLTGSLPPELADLTRLQILDLERNSLTGSIPPELGRMSSLRSLQLKENSLAGPIPAALAAAPNLRILDLENNDLTGTVPDELGSMTELRWLILNGNNLTGPLPSSLTDLQLSVLYIHENAGLCAPADDAFQDWLETVSQFRGDTCGAEKTVPDEDSRDREALQAIYAETDGEDWIDDTNWGTDEPFEHWYGVETARGRVNVLNLDRNNLTGSMPAALGDLGGLLILRLESNNLTGPVPPELGNAGNLATLRLDGNELTGPLPATLTNLHRVTFLDIRNNAGLCAPADDTFQQWLSTVREFRGEICGATVVPVLPRTALTLASLLLGGLGTGILLFRRSRVAAR